MSQIPIPFQLLDANTPNLDSLLGPLAGLRGNWSSASTKGAGTGTGWNVIAVPGNYQKNPNDGFVLEVIPYYETLSFNPITIAALNRGGTADQQVYGLIYEQTIYSDCNSSLCVNRGFPLNQVIHKETGMFLYLSNQNTGGDVARLSVIPHGNSLLAMGVSSVHTKGPVKINVPSAPTGPTVPGTPPILGYGEGQYHLQPQFPNFNQLDPSTKISEVLQNQTVNSVTTLTFSSGANNNILNIPFITAKANATTLNCIFWIEQIAKPGGGSFAQLQYSQTVNLVFPPTTGPAVGRQVIWPHVDVNTLTKTA